MSKALRTVAVIAGGAALIVGTAGLLAPAVAATATTAASAGGVLGVSAATLGTIATAATITATVASIGAQLTAPKPIARGSPARLVIDVEPPRPYLVGQVMTGGTLRHDVAYGADVAGVPNPYRWQVRVLSGVGPIQGVVSEHFDFEPISSFYTGFYATTQKLGDRPQAAALAPPYGAAPGWTSASKLSGCAHVGLNFLFDRDGEVFASGLPIYTALCDGEKVYDPRQDSTYPGGSGSCRAGDESTYVYNRNPACHAVTYALGRFQNGIRVFGLGQPVDTIDMAAIVDWANDCDTNGWTVNVILEEGGTGADLRAQRVANMDDICAAGGGRWVPMGGTLTFDWHRPRVSLATLTDDDILDAGGGTDAVPTVRDRMNGVRPQYISPDHNWQQITAAEIVGSTYRTEDGENLTQVYPLNGVTNEDQAGELAAYAMADSRELGPMNVQAKVGWRFYRPGDCITVSSSLMAYSGQAVINQRSLNPDNLAVALQLKSETAGKHTFALGKTAVPPPTPTLTQTSQERDLLAKAAFTPRAVDVKFDDGRNGEDISEAQEAVQTASRDITKVQAQLAEALTFTLSETSLTRQNLTDAGFFTDPETGDVRISGVEQNAERVSQAEIRISAAEASINLRATNDYVNQAIASAVLDPTQIADLDAVFARLTAAELDIDGLNATVTTLATATELTALTGRVTTAESEIDALEGQITTKVDTTTFDALDTRVTSAESTLSAIGDTAQIVNTATSVRLLEREANQASENALAALLQDDRNRREDAVALATARQELKADISAGDEVVAQQITTLQTSVAGNTASVTQIFESVNGIQARAGLALDVNGYITGWTLNNDGDSGDMVFYTDTFRLVSGQSGQPVEFFTATPQGVRLKGDLVVDGSITTAGIADNAVTSGTSSFVPQGTGVTNTPTQVGSVAITTTGGDVRIDFSGAYEHFNSVSNVAIAVSYTVKRGGVTIASGTFTSVPGTTIAQVTQDGSPGTIIGEATIPGSVNGTFPIFVVDTSAPAGPHTYTVELQTSTGSGLIESRRMIATEFKK